MFAACRGRFLHLKWEYPLKFWHFNKTENKKGKRRLRQFCSYIIPTVLMQASLGGRRGGWSHLWLLLDLDELGHVRKVFLVGFSHLLLCSLWVHDLQSLQITWLLTIIIIGDIKKRNNFFLPVEEWKLHWSWFLRSGLWPWTFLHTSCSASAAFADV